MIYYIACTETLLVKIGYTKSNPLARLKALQTGSAAKLKLIAVEPGELKDERELHERYAEHCVRGEWFAMCEELFHRLGAIVWLQASHSKAAGEPQQPWVLEGLSIMHAEKPLPPDLAEILEAAL